VYGRCVDAVALRGYKRDEALVFYYCSQLPGKLGDDATPASSSTREPWRKLSTNIGRVQFSLVTPLLPTPSIPIEPHS